MFDNYDDQIMIINLFKEFSIFPKEITDGLQCDIQIRRSPIEQFAHSYNLSLSYGRMQTFVKLQVVKHKTSMNDLRVATQAEFNKTVKSLISIHEPTINKYPEHTI